MGASPSSPTSIRDSRLDRRATHPTPAQPNAPRLPVGFSLRKIRHLLPKKPRSHGSLDGFPSNLSAGLWHVICYVNQRDHPANQTTGSGSPCCHSRRESRVGVRGSASRGVRRQTARVRADRPHRVVLLRRTGRQFEPERAHGNEGPDRDARRRDGDPPRGSAWTRTAALTDCPLQHAAARRPRPLGALLRPPHLIRALAPRT